MKVTFYLDFTCDAKQQGSAINKSKTLNLPYPVFAIAVSKSALSKENMKIII